MQDSAPSVLAVVVCKDGAPWLRRSLASLGRQTHPRLGVLAVDNDSGDDSAEILESVLGANRVIRLSQDSGFGAAVRRALSVPAARQADYTLILHDDAALAPDAVARLVEAARKAPDAGVIGPKVLDWEQPSVLLEVGHSSDRFGYPYSPLEEGEIDQGQYDADREVLFVSSAAMLLSRDAWTSVGLHDDRLGSHGDLDLGWRMRLSGFRVMVAPRAVVLHRMAGDRGERGEASLGRERYFDERTGLVSLLKNYRLPSLLWVLPLYAVQGVVRILIQVLGRHFDRAGQVVRAWGWNVIHLPGTIRRRVRAQSRRKVPDREVSKLMAPAGTRLRRWALQASALLVSSPAGSLEEDEEPVRPPLRQRVGSLALAHPVAVGWVVAALVTLFAFRDVLFVPAIEGGVFPVFPDRAGAFFREFAAGWRSTGFGGDGGASLALVPMGMGSFLSLGDPNLFGRLLVALSPLLAGAACYRALASLGADRLAGVVAASCYSLSALVLWATSEGRVGTIVLLISVPILFRRLWEAFGARGPRFRGRWMVGTGMTLALAASFFPSVWIAVALGVAGLTLVPERIGGVARGIALSLGAAVIGAILAFPFVLMLVEVGGGTSVGSPGGTPFSALLRLSPGPAPGSWLPALFLPLAALVAFALIEEPERRRAWRALLLAAAAFPLAWLAGAGRLPALLANPLPYLAVAAFSLCVLVGLAGQSLVPGMTRTSFGYRQVAVAALGTILGAGLLLQTAQAIGGGWAVGENRVSAAWPVVSSDPAAPFRVLWLGGPEAQEFPAPGGEPQGVVDAGTASVSFGVTGQSGRSVLATGLPTDGAAYDRLSSALSTALSGRVRHAGSLLAPFGIRYVVSGERALPPEAGERLATQVELDLVHRAAGLRIYRNARVLPKGSSVPSAEALEAARSTDPLAATELDPASAQPLDPGRGPGWSGVTEGTGVVLVAEEFDPAWSLDGDGGEATPFRSFEWGLAFAASARGGDVGVSFDGQTRRTVEVWALVVLWAAAMWAVRRRSADEERTPKPAARVAEASPPVAVREGSGT